MQRRKPVSERFRPSCCLQVHVLLCVHSLASLSCTCPRVVDHKVFVCFLSLPTSLKETVATATVSQLSVDVKTMTAGQLVFSRTKQQVHHQAVVCLDAE